MKFRKKPIVIEALQWRGTEQGATAIIDWILATGAQVARWHEQVPATLPDADDVERECTPAYIAIDTPEGTMRATAGDWIIRGVQGEFYPCKPDIFAATYEAVSE